jgi:hypothetical protein
LFQGYKSQTSVKRLMKKGNCFAMQSEEREERNKNQIDILDGFALKV